MNSVEQPLANKLMEEMKEKLRTHEYEAVAQLSTAYHNLCLAYEVRVRAEKQDPDKRH